MMNIHSPSFTSEELKEALKKFKEGMDDPVDSKQVCSFQFSTSHLALLFEFFFFFF